MRNNCITFLALILFSFISSCKKDEPTEPSVNTNSTVLIMGSGYTNQPGGFLTSYPNSLAGTVDNSNSQYALSLSNFSGITYKDKLFGALQTGTGMVKYGLNESGQLQQEGQLALINGHNRIAFVNENEAWFTSSGLLKIQQFNPSSMTLGASIDIAPLVTSSLPDAMTKNYKSCRDIFYRDGKLFVTLDFGLNDFTPAYDSAFVAVVDIASSTVETIRIKPNARMAGDVYPYTTSIVTDAANNLYILCIGSYGNITNDPSKVLRIPNGSTDFDSYELNITAQAGGSCRGFTKGADGIVYTAVLNPALVTTTYGFFTTPCYKFHKVNFSAQTVTDIGLPITTGFKGHAGITLNDTTYLPIFNTTEIAVYGYVANSNSSFKKCDVTAGGYIQFITALKK
jgi:hypothetical protein